MRSLSTVVLGVAAAALTSVPSTVWAQAPTSNPQRQERPYRALFGSGISNTEQSLTIKATFGAGRDTNVLTGSDATDETVAPPNTKTHFAQASGSINYALTRPRLGITATASASSQYFPTLVHPFVPFYGAATGATLGFGHAGHLDLGYTMAYSPFYYFGGLPSLGDGGTGFPLLLDQSAGTILDNYLVNSTTVGYGIDLTRKLSAFGNYGYSSQGSATHERDLSTHAIGGGVAYKLSRSLGLHLGYGHNEFLGSAAGVDTRNSSDQIDVGLNFNKTLSLTRRMTLTFATGVAGFKDTHATRYRFIGNAVLTREISRSWTATASYNRGFDFNAVFQQPLTSDSFVASVTGVLARRLQFSSSFAIGTGDVGLSATNNHYTSHVFTSAFNYGLTRALGLGVSYTNYRANFGDAVVLPAGVFHHANRQSVQAFVSVWAPLFTRTRRPDVTR